MGLVKPLPAQIAKIKVIGVGGGGGNTINYMTTQSQIQGVDLVAVNTDAQALLVSQAKVKIQIGNKLTRGLGAGGDPQVGQQAAEESQEKIKEVIEGTDMVFITGGLGGGTCSGAAPVIAKIAKQEIGALTVAVVTKPFLFEGTRRMVVAEDTMVRLKESVDTLIIVPNQRLLEMSNAETSFVDAFHFSDSVLSQGVQGIAELINTPGLINLDFADIRSVMKDAGSALMGVGIGKGENRAQEAIKQATSSPLLDLNIEGARGILFNITGGSDLTIKEVEQTTKLISQNVGGDANIIFGATIDEKFKGLLKITIIATGFDSARKSLSGLIQKTPAPAINEIAKKLKDNKPRKKPQDKETFANVVKIDLADKATKKIFSNLPKDLPEGLRIENELDIPSFLRRGSN